MGYSKKRSLRGGNNQDALNLFNAANQHVANPGNQQAINFLQQQQNLIAQQHAIANQYNEPRTSSNRIMPPAPGKRGGRRKTKRRRRRKTKRRRRGRSKTRRHRRR